MSKYSHSRQPYTPGRPQASGRTDKLLPLERIDSTLTKLCDLHVYKVPAELWRENFNNILNNVVTETVSIGIIRVPSETRLADLREEIIQQLQPDDMGPRDWVFLRSVGRSLTRLRTKQEYQLKAKHFLPPVAFAPEIYLLEATPEVRDALAISERGSSQSPPLTRQTSPSRGFPNTYRNGFGGEAGPTRLPPRSPVGRAPTASPQKHHYQPLPNIPPSSPPAQHPTHQYHDPHNDKNDTHQFQRNDTTHTQHNYTTSATTHHYHYNNTDNNHGEGVDAPWAERQHDRNKPAPETDPWGAQWRSQTPQKEAETAPVVMAAMAQPAAAAVERKELSRDSPDKSASRDYHRRPDDDSGVADVSPDDDYHNHRSSSRDRRHNSRRDEYDMLAKRLESDRFNLDDETDEERRRRLKDLEGRNMMDKQRWEADQDERRRQAEEDRKREEEERRRKEEEEERRRREEEEARRKREDDQRREEEERRRREEEEEKRRQDEERLRSQAKSPEEEPPQRDTESAKQRRREEMVRLMAEAAEARQARQDQEKEREELVKKAKALQHKTTNRRNDARDMWKKKYFEEKKKTAPLEENSNRLRQELEALHRRLMNTLEGPKEKNLRLSDNQPSQKSNYIIQCTKLQHDIEDLQRRVANAKMKLTAEMKLRNQAQGELRALRAELTQRKHNINKSRQQQLAALTPRPPANMQGGQINGPQYGQGGKNQPHYGEPPYTEMGRGGMLQGH